MFRHGDRSWMSHLPSTPDSANIFPDGTGQLSDLGILQEFWLGEWTRRKYPNLVDVNHNRLQFHMRSTDIERTLMSAESFITGLYRDANTPLAQYSIKKRPIAIHTRPFENDYVFNPTNCPRLAKLRSEAMNSPQSLRFEEDHRELFNLLSRESGLTKAVDRHNIWKIDDALICVASHNKTLPSWASDAVRKELQEVRKNYWWILFTANNAIIRFEIGLFLQIIADQFKAIVDDSTVPELEKIKIKKIPKIMAYSAHDNNIAYLLGALTSYREELPDYSAAIILELWGPPTNTHSISDFYVRVLYKHGWKDMKGVYLQHPDNLEYSAEKGCPLDVFIRTIQPFILKVEERESECRIEENWKKWLAIFGGLLAVVLVGILIGLSVFFYRRRAHKQNHNYTTDE